MEKFSAWRDPGTGVQPFLTPVPPQTTRSLTDYGTLVLGPVLGVLRSIIVFALVIAFGLLHLICMLALCWATFSFAYLDFGQFLPMLQHGKPSTRMEVNTIDKWTPGSGDIVVSNWASWIEVLWLAARYNPIFVLPVCAGPAQSSAQNNAPPTPGRRTGTGSAQIATASAAPRQQILGFRTATFLEVIRVTGRTPPYDSPITTVTSTIEDIRSKSDRPVVVFPECTTSNGRALIRFADVFIAGKGKHIKHPVKGFKMYIMCARYDPPTSMTPSPTHSIPSHSGTLPNPIPHLFTLIFAPTLTQSLSIRLLAPSDSPSSGSFMASEVILDNGIAPTDEISEACAVLMAQISKLRRVGMGWEDKVAFLDFYRKRKSL
ncbi:acyltransferase-like protein [Ceratobasidium theobromae]|uniref:Acyltransferase-like protein n=1 Tax=Ceratobasidium theobromae TaxID=1582974 RepID=A0A5N5QXK9_9AGAM|nr:acyltransferase-like protein [Ceratobasidium theobromae]